MQKNLIFSIVIQLSMKFFKIWEPFKIGDMEIKNRMIIPAMHLGDSDDGIITDKIIEFYRNQLNILFQRPTMANLLKMEYRFA